MLDMNRHREKPTFIYDRVPPARIDQYLNWRKFDQERHQKLTNNRFPELEKAREEFLGKEEDRSPHKKMHTQELIKFSEVVYSLA